MSHGMAGSVTWHDGKLYTHTSSFRPVHSVSVPKEVYQTVGTASWCPTHAGPDHYLLLHQSQMHKIQNGIPQVFRLPVTPSGNQSMLCIMPLQWLIVPSHSPLSMKCTLDGITSHIATNYSRIPHSGHIFSVPYTHIIEDHLIGLHQLPRVSWSHSTCMWCYVTRCVRLPSAVVWAVTSLDTLQDKQITCR